MTDLSFEELLNQTANTIRPQVEIGNNLQAANPTYELLEAGVAMRLRPTAAQLDYGLLGRFPQATAVAYLLPTDLAANDRLACVQVTTELTEAADVGGSSLKVASSFGITPGSRLHLRGGTDWEEVTVAQVEGQVVELTATLTNSFAAGETVEVVVSYQVLGVLDEAGASHHLKVALKRREL